MSKKLFSHTFLLLVSILTIIPLWVMFVTAFKSNSGVLGFAAINPFSSSWTIDNFITVWKKGNFGRYFLNSVMVTFFITVGNIIFDSMAAYALARRKFRGKGLLMGVIALKLLIPSVVLMVPTFILINKIGLYDSYAAIIFPMLTETFGIFLIRQYMLSLPVELEESARLEGYSDWWIFITIIFPLIMPVLAVVCIHSIMTSWNMYIYPLILTSSDSMRTLPLGLAFFKSSNSTANTAQLMAGAVIASLPVIILFLIYQRKIISGLTKGAVKG